MEYNIFHKRVVELNNRPINEAGSCVIYWMQRSQRAQNNLALKFAIDCANDLSKPLIVYFGLFDQYPMASVRMFKFMLEGLKETAAILKESGIRFVMRHEIPSEGICRIADELKACVVIVDEDYLNIGRSWRENAAEKLKIRLFQIDAETIVPARYMSKEEWGAYTIRPKINKQLDNYLVRISESEIEHNWKHDIRGIEIDNIDPLKMALSLNVCQNVAPSAYFTGGTNEALARAEDFIENGLQRYENERNDIGVSVTSGLSPYLHFGQISSLKIAIMTNEADAPKECKNAFLEQIIVRRELAINFCLYNRRYDTLDAAADWAIKTLNIHRTDEHPELYTLEELEQAETHDDLWNASQTELAKYGKIHTYLRMVWAKKIMEWSPTPEEALARAIYLNDKYALDGRDPNGYTNIAWCIYGKHDRAFAERPIFGKIRYMSTERTKAKTNWKAYIERIRKY